MLHFFDLNPDTLRSFAVDRGLPRFTAQQLLEWVYRSGVVDPQQMTNLSKSARSMLAEEITFLRGEQVAHERATDETQKLLLEWHDLNGRRGLPVVTGQGGSPIDRRTECVMIPVEKRRTACISSQVGCPVGCRFCASGLGGLDGNLTAGQIIEQVHHLARLPHVGRITNIVFMGMGEPLANYSAVTNAIRTINASWGFGISARRITVSTVGLPAAIRKLVDFEIPVTLALSLHAPNDALRRELIPWAEYSTVDELLDACDEYFRKTGREITLEYLLLRHVNDRPEHAHELAAVAKKLRANVNLIRYNEVRGLPYDRPTTDDVRTFQEILRDRKVNAHLRASRGRDIAAACGQLRHEKSHQQTAGC